MDNHTTKQNKYELRDQWYPTTPSQFGGFPIRQENDQNVYTKFIIYAPLNKAVNFRKEFSIKH